MNILYLCQLLPYPADAGPKVRTYYTLRYLAQHHRVTLLAFTRPEDRPEAIEHLQEFCTAVHTIPIRRSRLRDLGILLVSLVQKKSFIIQRDIYPAMRRKVDGLLASGQFEAMHADQLWMAQYALQANRLKSAGVKIQTVLDEHNACFQVYQRLATSAERPWTRWLWRTEWPKLRDFERQACAQFDHLATVTAEDRQTLLELLDTGQPALAHKPAFSSFPICVDTAEVQPVRTPAETKNILHLGTMFWPPNVEGVLWFARQVWPRVVAQIPQATFTIVGKNPPAEIQALATNNGAAPAIRVTGYVKDPLPYLQQAGVFIVPLFAGSGMRVKIVDAWRWGLPVVSTPIGAEGIHYQDGENILIAETAEDFAQAVVQVLLDINLAQALRRNGRTWVEAHYDWRQVYSAWDKVFPRT